MCHPFSHVLQWPSEAGVIIQERHLASAPQSMICRNRFKPGSTCLESTGPVLCPRGGRLQAPGPALELIPLHPPPPPHGGSSEHGRHLRRFPGLQMPSQDFACLGSLVPSVLRSPSYDMRKLKYRGVKWAVQSHILTRDRAIALHRPDPPCLSPGPLLIHLPLCKLGRGAPSRLR